jgi:hypothetical protein
MQRLVLLTAFVFGCADNALPTENNGGNNGATTAGTTGSTTAGGTTAGTNGSTTAGSTTAGGTTAGSTTAGGTTGTTGTTGSTGGTTGGPQGSPCKNTCDCQAGLACFQNTCQAAGMFMLYCCDSSSCPAGQVCQGSDGSFGMCGAGTTGGGVCKTACDCPQGEACFNGGCVMPPMGPLYCCETGCPSGGGICQSMTGSFGQCGGGMTTGTNGGTSGGTMCQSTPCMSSTDCTKVGCNNGCSMRTHMCR